MKDSDSSCYYVMDFHDVLTYLHIISRHSSFFFGGRCTTYGRSSYYCRELKRL